MEVFSVWSTFNLKGNAIEKMTRFSELTKISSQNVDFLSRQLVTLSSKLMFVDARAAACANSFKSLNRSISSANIFIKNNVEGMRLFNDSNLLAIDRVENLASKISLLDEKMESFSIHAKSAANNLSSISASRLRSTSFISEDENFNEQGGKKKKGISSIIPGSIKSGAAVVGGFGFWDLLKAGYEQDKEQSMLYAQLQALGYDPSQINQVKQFVQSTDIKGVSKTDILQSWIDAQMATRQLPSEAVGKNSEVRQFAPILAKMSFAAQALYGNMTEKQQQDAIRFADIMGGSSIDRRKEYLSAAMQMIVSSGGTIQPSTLLAFGRQAGGAFGSLSPQALVGLEPLFQELNGPRTATGLVTGLRQLITGTGSNFNKKQVQFLQSIGLLGASYDSEGRPLQVKLKGKKAENLLFTDPFGFVEQIVLPLLKKSGVDINNMEDLNKAVTLGFGRTYANEIMVMVKNSQAIYRQLAQLKDIQGVSGQHPLGLDTIGGQMKATASAWKDFAAAFGKFTEPATILGLKSITYLLKGLTKVIQFLSTLSFEKAKSNTYSNVFPSLSMGYDPFDPRNTRIPGTNVQMYSQSIHSVSNSQKNNQPIQISLNMDGKQMANALFNPLSNKMTYGGNLLGASTTNISLTPTSTNYNYGGSF